MSKKAILIEKIERCGTCPYYGSGWCNHSEGWKIVKDYNTIPAWCPLEDWNDEDAGKY